MSVKHIRLEHAHKSSLSSYEMDGICHIKTLSSLTVVQAVEGHYGIQLGHGEKHSTGSCGFFIAPANIQQTIVHHADSHTGHIFCRWVALRCIINDLYRLEDFYTFPVILPDSLKAEMNAVFNSLFNAVTFFEENVCYHQILEILSRATLTQKDPSQSQIHPVLEWIRENYTQKLTVELLAQRSNLSVSRFFAVFKKETGVPPMTYLNQYRLSVAAEQLLRTTDTITQIACSVGIDDPVYFNKLFRKAYQMSPRKYRRVYNSNIH